MFCVGQLQHSAVQTESNEDAQHKSGLEPGLLPLAHLVLTRSSGSCLSKQTARLHYLLNTMLGKEFSLAGMERDARKNEGLEEFPALVLSQVGFTGCSGLVRLCSPLYSLVLGRKAVFFVSREQLALTVYPELKAS